MRFVTRALIRKPADLGIHKRVRLNERWYYIAFPATHSYVPSDKFYVPPQAVMDWGASMEQNKNTLSMIRQPPGAAPVRAIASG